MAPTLPPPPSGSQLSLLTVMQTSWLLLTLESLHLLFPGPGLPFPLLFPSDSNMTFSERPALGGFPEAASLPLPVIFHGTLFYENL